MSTHPEKKKKRLSKITIDEVSFVDRGASEGARVALFKRHTEGDLMSDVDKGGGSKKKKRRRRMAKWASDLLNSIRKLGDSPKPEDIEVIVKEADEPRDFNEVFEDRMAFGAAEALDNRLFALSSAIFEIMISDSVNKGALVQSSLDQFVEKTTSDLPDILAGRIVKHFEKEDGPSSEEEVQTYLLSEFPEDVRKGFSKEDDMKLDLSKLPEDVRKQVEEQLAKTSELETQVTKLAGEIDELKKAAEKDKPKPNGDDILKDLDPQIRKIVEPLIAKASKDNDSLRESVTKLQDEARRSIIRKSVEELPAIAEKPDELVELLVKAQDAGIYESLIALLKAANEAAERGIFDEHGTSHGAEGGDAMAKIEAKVVELRKSDTKLTYEGAFAKVVKDNPELYDEYNLEQN